MCSWASTRAASRGSESPGSTGTAACARMGTGVERLGDEVDGATMKLAAGSQGTGVGVEAREGRQQAGMDVQHPARIVVDEMGSKQTHVAGQADDFDLGRLQPGDQLVLMRGSVAVERPMVDDLGGDAGRPGDVRGPRHPARLDSTTVMAAG